MAAPVTPTFGYEDGITPALPALEHGVPAGTGLC